MMPFLAAGVSVCAAETLMHGDDTKKKLLLTRLFSGLQNKVIDG